MSPTVAVTNSHPEQPAALTRAIKTGLVWGAITLAAVVVVPKNSLADEGGVSFWMPGLFGSLAATPQQPGWSLANIDYYTNVSAGGAVALAKELQIRNLPLNIQARINANVHATGALNFVVPAYVFAHPQCHAGPEMGRRGRRLRAGRRDVRRKLRGRRRREQRRAGRPSHSRLPATAAGPAEGSIDPAGVANPTLGCEHNAR
jgi:hypothetical protein